MGATPLAVGHADDVGARAEPTAGSSGWLRSEHVPIRDGMAYIIERKNRFYVVAYDGIDPATGRERRRWHPAGHSRTDAEAIAARLDAIDEAEGDVVATQLRFGRYLTERFMPMRRQRLQSTTAYRYEWMIEHYINPVLGSMPLRSVRSEHLGRLYNDLLTTGGVKQAGLAPKRVYDVHVVIRSTFTQAVRQHLVTVNPALGAQPPRSRLRQRSGPECWTAEQLAEFLAATRHLRLHPALHLAAFTGMRRGELAGLRWGDWHRAPIGSPSPGVVRSSPGAPSKSP